MPVYFSGNFGRLIFFLCHLSQSLLGKQKRKPDFLCLNLLIINYCYHATLKTCIKLPAYHAGIFCH